MTLIVLPAADDAPADATADAPGDVEGEPVDEHAVTTSAIAVRATRNTELFERMAYTSAIQTIPRHGKGAPPGAGPRHA